MDSERDKQEKLNKAAGIIKRGNLPPSEAMKVLDEVAGKPDYAKLLEDKITCVCGRNMSVAAYPIVNTGVVSVVYNVCPGCRREADSLAHLCCLKCRMTVGHLYPHKEPTGFEFVGGKFYHINSCPQCEPKEKGRADVVEKVLFFRMNNIPMKHDPEFD